MAQPNFTSAGSNGNLQATSGMPAFVSNERMRRKAAANGAVRGLNDCCYSISNLALIAACVVAIIFTAKFFNDDPLYEIGDYLLTLRFYRQLIFVIVILPLLLLLPLFNAISACFLSTRSKLEVGRSILIVRIVYVIIMVVLVFVALAFVAPHTKVSSVQTQIDHEIRRHIERLYQNQFSQEFLDRIQLEYKCCEQLYYTSNFNGKLPLSCFLQDGFFNTPFKYTCADVLGSMVGLRCIVITICLVIILFALASLIAMDVVELVRLASGHYDVAVHESHQSVQSAYGASPGAGSTTNRPNSYKADDDDDDDEERAGFEGEDLLNSDQISDRLKLDDREREAPLLPRAAPAAGNQTFEKRSFRDIGQPDPYNCRLAPAGAPTSPILTRANYLNNQRRSQSPLFVSNGHLNSPAPTSGSGPAPAKSVLKKSTSFSRIDSDEEDAEEVLNYQRQLQRELQTRRSLLNVRFAE